MAAPINDRKESLKKMERWERVGLFGALLAAAGVRLWMLGGESLWLDELFSVRAATREDLAGLVAEVRADVHPPLFYVLLRMWIAVFGDADRALRALPALIGVAGVGATWLLARRLFGDRAAVAAAWMLAVAPFAVDLDRELRANTLMALLSTLATACLARRGAPGSLPLYALLVGLLGWTHSFGLLVVVAHGIWMLAEVVAGEGSRVDLRRWFQATVAGLLLTAPWFPVLAAQSTSFGAHPWYAPPAPDTLGWLLPALLGGGGPAVLLLVGLGLLYARGEAGSGGRLVVAMVAGLVLVAQAVSLGVAPILRDRNVIALLPILVTGAAAGLVRVPGVGGGLVALVVGASAFVTGGNLGERRKEDWRGAAEVVQAGWRPGDRVDANFTTLWAHYLPQVWEAGAEGGRTWVVRGHDEQQDYGPEDAGEMVEEWWFPGAHVLLRDPAVHTVPLGRELGMPMWDGTRLHYYWNQSVRSPVQTASGACSVGIVGRGDEADGAGAELVVRLIVDEAAAHAWTAMLPAAGTTWWSPVVDTGPAAVEVEFVNDGAGTGPDGAPADRNAHLERVLLRCNGLEGGR